jgi:DNA-binding response OmpR family regulator
MRVLICDDEPSIRQLYRYAFEHEGAEVDEAGDGNECIVVADREHPDLIVLDLYMPVRDGLSALPELRHCSPASRVLVVSAHAGVEIFSKSRALGATACYEKLGFLRKIPEILARYAA